MALTRRNKAFALASVSLTVAALLAAALSAHAVTLVPGAPGIVASSLIAGQTSTYTFGSYESARGADRPQWFRVTFPAGFNVSGATLASPTGTIARSGQTLTVTFNPELRGATPFTVSIANVVNPAVGTYSFPNAEIHTRRPGGQDPQTHSLPIPSVTILSGALNVTLSTNLVEFSLTPDVPAPPQSVTLTVSSASAFTITREITGDAGLIGLSVSGHAAGPKPAGNAAFQDTYSAAVPWTTEGDRVYTATVTYTVVQ